MELTVAASSEDEDLTSEGMLGPGDQEAGPGNVEVVPEVALEGVRNTRVQGTGRAGPSGRG